MTISLCTSCVDSRHSWCHSFYKSAVRDRPLLLDENYGKKRAWYGASNALHEAVALYDQQQQQQDRAIDDSDHHSAVIELLPAVLQQDEVSWGSGWMLPEPEQLQGVEQAVAVAVDEPDWNCMQSSTTDDTTTQH
jgi:hypothetical protein